MGRRWKSVNSVVVIHEESEEIGDNTTIDTTSFSSLEEQNDEKQEKTEEEDELKAEEWETELAVAFEVEVDEVVNRHKRRTPKRPLKTGAEPTGHSDTLAASPAILRRSCSLPSIASSPLLPTTAAAPITSISDPSTQIAPLLDHTAPICTSTSGFASFSTPPAAAKTITSSPTFLPPSSWLSSPSITASNQPNQLQDTKKGGQKQARKGFRLGIALPKRSLGTAGSASTTSAGAITTAESAASGDTASSTRPAQLQSSSLLNGVWPSLPGKKEQQQLQLQNRQQPELLQSHNPVPGSLKPKVSTGSLRAFFGLDGGSRASILKLVTVPPGRSGNNSNNTKAETISNVSNVQGESPLGRRNGIEIKISTPPRLHLSDSFSSPTSPTSKTNRQSFARAVMAALPLPTTLHHDEATSDISSVISLGDRPVLSSSEDEEEKHLHDTQKYRLPDVGKSRGSSRNGFILEDGSAVDRRQQHMLSTPTDETRLGMNRTYSMEDLSPEDGPVRQGDGYFNPFGLTRSNSVYTLSRASFSNQLSQLTSIKLPQANFLASSISSIPTSAGAARALNDAADQIRIWITKASEVLDGLDAEDDVEWAAAGGREGLGEVDAAINRFESLINVYVTAIENLEKRPDIENLSGADLTGVVTRMEKILQDWARIKDSLEGVKQQVEMAMRWEDMWNTVLGEIGMEEEKLSRLIFEMEETRHKNHLLDSLAEPGQGLDIKELETIVEEAPAMKQQQHQQAKMALSTTGTPKSPQVEKPATEQDSNLLAMTVTAKLQPLRAALDFLPMRLAEFFDSARNIFPTACDELERRVEVLEAKYRKLELDAESLRKELGEDRWILIFRKAGRQALKICESVERSVAKLREALEEGAQHTNPTTLAKKIENYEAKKLHYGPAIEKVLAIIDRGVQTRLTVNGEILRLQADMQKRWGDLEAQLKGMDFALEQLNVSRGGNGHASLRDSISTILSEQRSVASSTGTLVDTPGSSPASSVVLLGRLPGSETPRDKSRQSSFASSTATARSTKRLSSLPAPKGASSSTLSNRSSSTNLRASIQSVSSRLYPGPSARSTSRQEERQNAQASGIAKPKWNSSTSMRDTTIGHNFRPLSHTEESPYRRDESHVSGLRSPRSYAVLSSSTSGIPSPLGKVASSTTGAASGMTPRRPGSSLALRSHTHASGIPNLAASTNSTKSQLPVTPTPGRTLPPMRATSMYGTPSGGAASQFRSGLRSPPPTVTNTRRHVSSNSVTSVGSKSSSGSTQGTLRGLSAMTPGATSSSATASTAGSPGAGSGPASPLGMPAVTSNRYSIQGPLHSGIPTATSASTAGNNRRLSMLPTPKRLSSASNTQASAAAAAAMVSGVNSSRIPGTTPQPNRAGAGSRAGSRLGMRLGDTGTPRGVGDIPGKPKWR